MVDMYLLMILWKYYIPLYYKQYIRFSLVQFNRFRLHLYEKKKKKLNKINNYRCNRFLIQLDKVRMFHYLTIKKCFNQVHGLHDDYPG